MTSRVGVTRRPAGPPLLGYIALLVAVAAVVAGPLSGLSTSAALDLLGIPDPGPLTSYGLPIVRSVAEIFCALAVGLSFYGAFYTPPQKDGTLDVAGYRSQHWASMANAVWAVCAAMLIPLTLSDVSGQKLTDSLSPDQWLLAISSVDVASSWRWAAIIAIVAAIGQRLTLTWRWSVIWLALSMAALLPIAATGHAASSGAHDIATNSLVLHLVGSVLWMGGLAAIVLHALRGDGRMRLALRRHSAVATVALFVVAASGVINALVRIQPGDLLTTTYGRLIIAKAVLIVVIAVLAIGIRRRLLGLRAWPKLWLGPDRPGSAASSPMTSDAPISRARIWAFAGVETAVMAATFAVAVSLGRTPPPPPPSIPTVQEALLGFELPGNPTLITLITNWRFDLILGTVSLVAIALYSWGLIVLRRRGDSWPVSRTIFWMAGSVLLFLTTSSGLGMYMMGQFSLHMVAHMLLSMMVPVFWALGGPLTLALRALRPAGRGNPPGPREWILELIHNPISWFLTHPVVASIQFVLGFYLVYFGGFYDTLAGDHFGHVFMNVHFLISGYLFYWSIIGVDTSPHDYSPLFKLLTLLGSLPFHAFFGIMLMLYGEVLAPDWYGGLELPWVPDLLADQKEGGGIAWGFGEIPLFVVMIALAFQWYSADSRDARRSERKADRDDDAELRAYNEMLRQMDEGTRSGK